MGFSVNSVGTSIDNLNISNHKKVNVNVNNINSNYQYEEIDYNVNSDFNLNDISILGDTIEYEINGITYQKNVDDLIQAIATNDSYNELIKKISSNYDINELVNALSPFHELLSQVNNNNILLSETTMNNLMDLDILYDIYIVKQKDIQPLTQKEELESLKNIIKERIDELNPQVKALEDEYNTALIGLQNPIPFMQDYNDGNLKKAEETSEKLKPIKGELATLESYLYQIEQQLLLAPYEDLRETDKYKAFTKNYNYNNLGIDYEQLRLFGYDIYSYINEQARGKSQAELDEMLLNRENQIDQLAIVEFIVDDLPEDKTLEEVRYLFPDLNTAMTQYMFMSEEQRNMYHFLFNTEGEEAANSYLDVIQDSLNQAEGVYLANEFINSLNFDDEGKLKEDLANYFGVSVKGLGDGIDTFFEGLGNVIANNDKLTVDDYQKMVVLQYLKENSIHLDEAYEFNSALGNMLPAMTTSAIVSLLATPAAGSLTASGLMGLSAAGNAKHQALVEGNDLLSSTLYGLFVGSSEATLGYFLGKIPGISQASGFTLKNLLSEGVEEGLQEWVDAGLQAVVLGKDVDWQSIPTQSKDSFIMGVLMAGFLNGGQSIVNITINGVNQEINVEEILDYIESNPNISLEAAILESNPKLSDLFKKQTTTNNNEIYYNDIKRYGYKQQYANIMNQAQFEHNAFSGVYHEIERVSNLGNIYEIRNTCRAGIEFLIKECNYTYEHAVNEVSNWYRGILNNRGFHQSVDSNTGIIYNEIVNLNTTYQKANAQKVVDLLSILPPDLVKLIKVVNIYDTFNPYDFYWEREYKTADFVSAATGGQGEINIWGSANPNSVGITLNTLAHETAHTYDRDMAYLWGVQGDSISSSNIWLDAIAKDKQLTNKDGCTDYGATASSEDFAEAVALYYSNPNALDQFPNRKALLEKYLPKKVTLASTYDQVYNIMVTKFGEQDTIRRLREYSTTGNANLITRDGGARDLLTKYSVADFKNYLDQIEIDRINSHFKAVEQSFNLAFGALIRKYGANMAVDQMEAYISSGDLNKITRSEGARDALRQFSVEDIKTYIKTINGGSLELKRLFGGV